MLGIANLISSFAVSNNTPASLKLTSWWRAPFSGIPWANNASRGTSASNGPLDHNLNDPTVGASQNGYGTVLFTGASSQSLVNSNTLDIFFTAAAGSILFGYDAFTQNAPGANIYEDAHIFGDFTNGGLGVAMNTNGVNAFLFDGAYQIATATWGTGGFNFGMMRWDSTNLGITVNSSSEITTPCGAFAGPLANTVDSGTSYLSTNFLDGRMLEIMTANYTFTNAQYNLVKTYMNNRYALAF